MSQDIGKTDRKPLRPRMSERLRLVWGADLPWKEKYVLLALNELVWDGAGDFPSMDELARLTGLSRHTILRAIESLRTMAILGTEKRPGFRTGNTTLRYQMKWVALDALPKIELGAIRRRASRPIIRPLFNDDADGTAVADSNTQAVADSNTGCSCEQLPQAVADSNSLNISAPLKEAAAASDAAAAALLKGLTEAGLGEPNANSLIERYAPERILKALAQRQAAIDSGKAIGPGLVYRAIANGEEITERPRSAGEVEGDDATAARLRRYGNALPDIVERKTSLHLRERFRSVGYDGLNAEEQAAARDAYRRAEPR